MPMWQEEESDDVVSEACLHSDSRTGIDSSMPTREELKEWKRNWGNNSCLSQIEVCYQLMLSL